MSNHPIDVHVGERLREARKEFGMSQTALGELVDLSFQQIQKYEKGKNRIGSSRLWEFCGILNQEITYFFEGLDDAPTAPIVDPDTRRTRTELAALIDAGIPPHVIGRFLALVRELKADHPAAE